jgi:hypothetical protein
MDKFSGINEVFIQWLLSHGIKIAGIAIVTYLLYKFGGSFMERVIRRAVKPTYPCFYHNI